MQNAFDKIPLTSLQQTIAFVVAVGIVVWGVLTGNFDAVDAMFVLFGAAGIEAAAYLGGKVRVKDRENRELIRVEDERTKLIEAQLQQKDEVLNGPGA